MIGQCEKCALYNSLGCPYDYESASKDTECDEFRPDEENKITDPIKRKLFNLLKDSPSLAVLYDEQWAESVEYLVSNGVTIKEMNSPNDCHDMVKVVRCKDCKKAKKTLSGYYTCPYTLGFYHYADDYCSYGERREEKENA